MSRYRVTITASAASDFRDAFEYLFERSPRAAFRFAEEVEHAFASLREDAHIYAVWRDPFRRLPLDRFPHGVLYELVGDQVTVAALAHPRRDPWFWSKRREKSESSDE